jgi:hypothetical protein
MFSEGFNFFFFFRPWGRLAYLRSSFELLVEQIRIDCHGGKILLL